MTDHEMDFLPRLVKQAKTWIRVEVDQLQGRDETRPLVASGARLSANYLLMNAAATLRGYGLLSNSEAVIIGAMLIAMLYGPILAIGMAFAELDGKLLGRAPFCGVAGRMLGLLYWVPSWLASFESACQRADARANDTEHSGYDDCTRRRSGRRLCGGGPEG
jgi:hypothetical protein